MSHSNRQISTLQGIYTQANSILGVSIITFPYTFCQLGYVLSGLFTIFMCACSAYTLYFLTKSAKDTHNDNLDELVETAVGKKTRFFFTMIFYSACILPLIFYLDMSTSFYNDTIKFLGFGEHRIYVAVVTAFICAFICIIFQTVEKLEFVSIGALLSLIFFILYVVYDFITNYNKINFAELKTFNLSYKTLSSVSFIIFAFISHSSIIPIMDCVEPLSSCTKVIITANIIATIFYLITGFLGFAARPNSEKIYLLNAGGNKAVKTGLKFFLATVNVLSFPLMMIPARRNLLYFIGCVADFKDNQMVEHLLTCLNVIVALVVVVLMKKMDFLENLFFIIGAMTMFIIPVVLFHKTQRRMSIFSYIFSVFSIPLSFFSIFMGLRGFYEMITKKETE